MTPKNDVPTTSTLALVREKQEEVSGGYHGTLTIVSSFCNSWSPSTFVPYLGQGQHDGEDGQLDDERHEDARADADALLVAHLQQEEEDVHQLKGEGEVVDVVVLYREGGDGVKRRKTEAVLKASCSDYRLNAQRGRK